MGGRARVASVVWALGYSAEDITGVGVLDPSVPPKKPRSLLLRILAVLVLIGFIVLIGSMFLSRH
jgi:hypothetical protein